MEKSKNVKNLKGYVKKVNIYIKYYKVISNRNVKPNKKEYIKATNTYKCV